MRRLGQLHRLSLGVSATLAERLCVNGGDRRSAVSHMPVLAGDAQASNRLNLSSIPYETVARSLNSVSCGRTPLNVFKDDSARSPDGFDGRFAGW